MYLEDCKAQVDAGHTAKHIRWRSILYFLVRRERGLYAKQAQGYTNPNGVVIVKQETTFYLTWEELVDSLEWYAISSSWEITSDPFEPYIPPEQK